MKHDKLLNKVLNHPFLFPGSQEDLQLVQAILNGTDYDTKGSNPNFQAYAAVVNIIGEFSTQVLDVRQLIPFNNQLADLQEEYMPSYPPMSPVTTSFFATWMALDARETYSGATLGEMFAHYIKSQHQLAGLGRVLEALNDSYCSFYEVTDVSMGEVQLWDIAGTREIRCWNSSRYPGCSGEVWYARLLPPLLAGYPQHITLNTPYVFKNDGRQTWEDFFQRQGFICGNPNRPWREYLKFGKTLYYWLEFVMQAYVNYTGNAIFVEGFPDKADSRPHAEHGHTL